MSTLTSPKKWLEEVRLESVKNGGLNANLGLLSNHGIEAFDREALAQ